MNKITKLSWDTKFFGFGVGKISAHELTQEELEKMRQAMLAMNIKLVYCFIDPRDTISSRNLKKENYKMVDEKITFEMRLGNVNEEISGSISSYINKQINKRLISLALQSGEYSRFKIDKHFSQDSFEKLYTTWLENSLNNKLAKDVLVYSENGQEAGLITLGEKNNHADIGLLAVDEEYRGRGIGKKLLHAAFLKARELGFSQIQVVTQKQNKGACLFYKKMGFIPERVENIYHIWLNQTAYENSF